MKVLLVPSVRAGMGSGHLRRSLHLAEIFGPDSAVLIEAGDQGLISDPQRLLKPLIGDSSTLRVLYDYDPEEHWDLVILDRRSSGVEQVRRFSPTPVVGLDEGGASRPYLGYLIDTFPAYRQRHRANLSALSLLDLPEKGTDFHFPFRRVLISFGGEDPADLSGSLLEALLREHLFEPKQITVVRGPYFHRSRWPDGIEVLQSPEDLKSILHRYDLVFCSFGLTTYEALAAGVPVINLNPTACHRRLSAVAGIPEVGVRRPSLRKLRRLIDKPQTLEAVLLRYPNEILRQGPGVSELPLRLQPSGPARCPVCSEAVNPAVARFAERSYFRCRSCGILYLVAFGREKTHYDGEYFFAEYKRQYGKTYLEDFEAIKGMAHRRLGNILPVLASRRRKGAAASSAPDARAPGTPPSVPPARPAAPPRLLDVGCAYGPFLQAARERGFQVQGLDVSPEAVSYVREELRLPCSLGDFSSADCVELPAGADAGFDVISLWYVIEHFRDTERVLRRINRLLEPGGVFSFSTPNASGISARKDRNLFFKNSPTDHCTVWPLRAVVPLLARFGFELQRIVVTGHHGERFPWPGRLGPDFPIAAALSRLSRLLRLGDTFEAYAVKVRDLP